MKRILGMGVGVVYLFISYAAFSRARTGWDAGHGEIGFWFSVIAAFLLFAALAAMIGTWIHTQETSDAAH